VDDLSLGSTQLPPTDGLRYRMPGARIIVRPSGTEPKLKCYLDTWSTDGTAAERSAAADALLAKLDAGMRELLS
jgi:phosphomannomutase